MELGVRHTVETTCLTCSKTACRYWNVGTHLKVDEVLTLVYKCWELTNVESVAKSKHIKVFAKARTDNIYSEVSGNFRVL